MASTWLLLSISGALAIAIIAFFHPLWLIRILARLFGDIVWFGPSSPLLHKTASSKPRIFLTIDDAPSGPGTKSILATLRQHNAHATFFCIGSYIEKYQAEFTEIIASGHSVGNHTMFDRKSVDLSASELDYEIKTTEALIESGFSKADVPRPPLHLRFFRPGHGIWNKTLLSITKKVCTWEQEPPPEPQNPLKSPPPLPPKRNTLSRT